LRQRLRRHKLVFVQLGAAFSCMKTPIIEALGGTHMTAAEFVQSTSVDGLDSPLLLDRTEDFISGETLRGTTLGQLRKRVDEALDQGGEVCLISSSPKIAFKPVPGSSVIEDTSVAVLSLLEEKEVNSVEVMKNGWQLPAIGLCGSEPIVVPEVLRDVVDELGLEMLASLDYALFEAGDRKSFLDFITTAEAEALRGAGLVAVSGEEVSFSVPRVLNEFVDEVANALADVVHPQRDLALVSEDLWYIERTIRLNLRKEAIRQFEGRWRRNVLHGDQSSKVLERVRNDGNVTVGSISQLRDPIEWLTLGELLEVVQSSRFNGLRMDDVAWRRFASDVLPIRNRLSHMRILKKGDRETVQMWVVRIRKAFE
jgi:hypothetical protein